MKQEQVSMKQDGGMLGRRWSNHRRKQALIRSLQTGHKQMAEDSGNILRNSENAAENSREIKAKICQLGKGVEQL